MRRLLYATLALVCIVAGSCKQPQNQFSLDAKTIFSFDSVSAFVKGVSRRDKDSSQKIFSEALDLLKNRHDAGKSIGLFIRSLVIYPNAKAYYELGNAYLENYEAEHALDAFSMAERLDYSPQGYLLFKKACCYAQMDRLGDMYDYISYAVENGFVDRTLIFNDKFLQKYKNDERFVSAYNDAMAGNGDADAILWEGFSRDFDQASFPLVIDSGYYHSKPSFVSLAYDYDKFIVEMRDAKFSRDVGEEFFYVAKVIDSSKYKTVIYGCKPYDDDNGGPARYYMATFNIKGRLVDKQMIAGAKFYDSLYNVFSMPDNKQFEIKHYSVAYEKDVQRVGYTDNPVTKMDLVSSDKYTIDSAGRFIAATQPAAPASQQ